VDKPAKQARSKESGDTTGIARSSSEDLRENEADVPLYDRVTPSLSGQELKKDGWDFFLKYPHFEDAFLTLNEFHFVGPFYNSVFFANAGV
jgi:hypothetical protein